MLEPAIISDEKSIGLARSTAPDEDVGMLEARGHMLAEPWQRVGFPPLCLDH